MIIDSHTHLGKFPGTIRKSTKDLLLSMDKAGIEISLVIADTFRDHEKDGVSTEEIIKITQRNPRLKGIGNISYSNHGEQRLDYLKRMLLAGKILGVKLYPGYEYFYPYDQKLLAFYKFCESQAFPIIFHSGLFGEDLSGKLQYSHPLHIDEVATEFPKLNIVIAHFGNPWTIDCAAVVAKNKNVYVDLSAYFTPLSLVSEEEQGEFILELGKLELVTGNFKKCLFGTDWPLYSQTEHLSAVQKLPFSEEERNLCLSENARRVFHL